MGVPAFYRWLVEKYPKIKVPVLEDKAEDADITSANPNGLEFDNLYLDMNGIIHPCFHPDDALFPPTTYEDVFENIYAYIERLFRIIRPRKLLYLAIDGVAPRAKMNQQRSRRFKTAKDNEFAEVEERKLREEFEKKGKRVLPQVESQVSDSNVVTPGTEFMHELSKALSSYIVNKLRDDPVWRDIKVVLSDATVPGEGEHKIMSFIRAIRCLPDYNPNTRHCLYGLDADLIMLALATHVLHFSILREDVIARKKESAVCESALSTNIQNNSENPTADSMDGPQRPFFDVRDKSRFSRIQPQHYEFLHVWILREYLELDMQIEDPPEKFGFDIERIVDDFIFICLFVGNDFLPHMPTLEINEDGIDLLMHVYKKEFKNLGGYLVDMQRVNDQHAGYVKLKRVEKFILCVGSYEEKIFKKRTEKEEQYVRRIQNKFSESPKNEVENEYHEGISTVTDDQSNDSNPNVIVSISVENFEKNTKELKDELKERIRKKSDTFSDGNFGSDKVKLGSTGYKVRYYKEKFSVEEPKEVEKKRKEIVHKYAEGLCWVLLYYFQGIPSWNWYYPFYYGTFASDLRGLASAKVRFQKRSPFKPFDQLMAVLPPRSAHALPKAYRQLMTDSLSSIIHFYPHDFEVDVDGKRFQWQGVCKLPFIDEEQLLSAIRNVENDIEGSEGDRNLETTDKLFIVSARSHDGGITSFLGQEAVNTQELYISKEEDDIICCNMELPKEHCHVPRLLEGINYPDKIISESDVKDTVLWHEYKGRKPTQRFPAHNNRRTIADDARIGKTPELACTYWNGRGKGANCRLSQCSKGSSTHQNRNERGFWQATCIGSSCRGVQNSHSTVVSDAGKSDTSAPFVHKHAGTGWAGRGRDVGQRDPYHLRNNQSQGFASSYNRRDENPKQFASYRSTLVSTSTQNVERGMESLRLSSPDAYIPPGRRAPHAQESSSTSWKASSHTRPNCTSAYGERMPTHNPNRNNLQFSGRGRGHYRPYAYCGHASEHPNSR